MQPSEKSLSAPGNPKASTHTNRCLSCLFSARKSFALPRPPGAFLCFCPVSSAHGQSLPQAPPLLPGWRPRPRGFFYTINSEKTNAHVLLQNQTRVCGIVRCTACSAFFDRARQPVPAVLACGKDLLQIGYGAGFFKAVKKEKHRAVSPDVFLRQIPKKHARQSLYKFPKALRFLCR